MHNPPPPPPKIDQVEGEGWVDKNVTHDLYELFHFPWRKALRKTFDWENDFLSQNLYPWEVKKAQSRSVTFLAPIIPPPPPGPKVEYIFTSYHS